MIFTVHVVAVYKYLKLDEMHYEKTERNSIRYILHCESTNCIVRILSSSFRSW